MHLEGVIVCVNYSDFLAHTLPHNKHQFDHLVVVTSHMDEDTKLICKYHNVQCIETDKFYDNGDVFNKGAGINEGLKHLSCDGWVLHMDADIYLPPLTRTTLNNLPLDSLKIYGCDRLMCPSYDEWIEFISNPREIHSDWTFVHSTAFPVGSRIVDYNGYHKGWSPIGFWQLWNPKKSKIKKYPETHGYCDRTDVLHSKKFDRAYRELLPEIVVIHLDSEGNNYVMGVNWSGRKTAYFGPSKIQPNLVKSNTSKNLFSKIKKTQHNIIKSKYRTSKISFLQFLLKPVKLVIFQIKKLIKFITRSKT